MTRDEVHAKGRAAFLAGLGDADDDAEESPKPAVRKPAKIIGAPVDDDLDDDALDAADEPDLADDDDVEADEPLAADADDDEPDVAADADPETAKRQAAVRRTEQRARERMATERASFERERSEWQAQTKELTESKRQFDQLSARAKYDSYSVLRALGVSDDDMLVHAQLLYSRSKDAAVKPEHRAASDREMRQRELSDQVARAEAKTAKLEADIAAKEQDAANAREAAVYLRRVVSVVDDTAPLTKQLVAANPAKARAALSATALELAEKLGRLPKAAKVIAAHERKLASHLRDLGIAAPGGAGAAPAKIIAKAKPGAAPAKAKPAADAPTDRVNGAVVIPSRADIVKEMEELS